MDMLSKKRINDSFQDRLSDLVYNDMQIKEITQFKVAKNIGIQATQLSKYLNGGTEPRLTAIRQIANYFKVSMDYLTGYTDIKSIKPTVRLVCKYTNLSENAVKNIIYISQISNKQLNENEIITNTALLNELLSKKCLSLIDNLNKYINYRVDDNLKWNVYKNDLYLSKIQTNLLGEREPVLIPDNFMEEVYLKNIITDIENLKKVLVAENDKKIADRKADELKRAEREEKAKRRLF